MHEFIFHKTNQGEKDYNEPNKNGITEPDKMRFEYDTPGGDDPGEILHPEVIVLFRN